ncbi:proteasome-type protease [Rhodovulum sulfidophilum]|uniref:proteasome-type protease n=1 Tax=Rhodovulum sulfidophilum TaxID=35806 RepID=UPI0019224168|nr:proteasome-type protease [Rhodovulum sulfidophilum]MBL3575717.1 proteasome-type protease [Rhodovulum sulfidophilum]MCE8431573.1 proteasome-type protease [Rhodovulum sulfidophilum]MCF4117573.1 proteasome-type protease [Rhodovulum sulfidophilum]
MTYCVGLMLERGLVMMSDTRTNAGVDNVSTFGKMFTWEKPGERALVLMTAGNLATTQSVVSILDERTKAHGERDPSLFEVPSMFQAARLVAATLKDVIAAHADVGQRADASFNATLILGGQIKGGAPRLFLIYPEGNFIEAGVDTPFFQIGETKYGRPILVRAYDAAMSFEKAVKVMLVSFDSTLKANLSVGMPFDLQIYETDSLQLGRRIRIDPQDPYFERISTGWGEALKSALDSLPDFEF